VSKKQNSAPEKPEICSECGDEKDVSSSCMHNVKSLLGKFKPENADTGKWAAEEYAKNLSKPENPGEPAGSTSRQTADAVCRARASERAAFSRKEAAAKRTEEICDNCDKIKELTEINYLTRRQKVKLILCEECLNQFADIWKTREKIIDDIRDGKTRYIQTSELNKLIAEARANERQKLERAQLPKDLRGISISALEVKAMLKIERRNGRLDGIGDVERELIQVRHEQGAATPLVPQMRTALERAREKVKQ